MQAAVRTDAIPQIEGMPETRRRTLTRSAGAALVVAFLSILVQQG